MIISMYSLILLGGRNSVPEPNNFKETTLFPSLAELRNHGRIFTCLPGLRGLRGLRGGFNPIKAGGSESINRLGGVDAFPHLEKRLRE